MRTSLLKFYGRFFGKRRFSSFHLALLKMCLKGMGIFNTADDRLSGETNFLHKLLQRVEQPLVLDVGANVGIYASMIKSLAPDATIYAFEPHPQTFKRLYAAARHYGYTAINMGCDSAAGTRTLYDYAVSDKGSTHASFHKDALQVLHQQPVSSWEVQITTLDHFITMRALTKVHLLKIDTEGHELRVLEGAKQAIASDSIEVIQFEFNQMNVASRVFFRDFYDLLPDYSFYRLLPDELAPLGPYQPVTHEIFGDQNIVAIHKNSKLHDL
jgi:FkbM family methyltransferase